MCEVLVIYIAYIRGGFHNRLGDWNQGHWKPGEDRVPQLLRAAERSSSGTVGVPRRVYHTGKKGVVVH